MTQLGPVVDAMSICQDLESTLKLWLPSILHELAVRKEMDPAKLRAPRTWERMSDFRTLSRDKAPACIVTTTGTEGEPSRDADGNWSATWRLHAYGLIAAGRTQEAADLTKLYVAAIRTAALQHGLDGDYRRPVFKGENYAVIATDKPHTVMAGVAMFTVEVGDIVNDFMGPAVPPESPDYDDGEPGVIVQESIVSVDSL